MSDRKLNLVAQLIRTEREALTAVMEEATGGRVHFQANRVGGLHEDVPRGWTDRVITPEAPPRIIDGLVTGWHDPMASHLLLVEAVAGERLTQAAYDAAVAEGYLWHEFGDSALLMRR